MAYVPRVVKAGPSVAHKKMQSFRVHTKGVKRSPNTGHTTEKQERINERVAEEHLRWDINANFGIGISTPFYTTTSRTVLSRRSWRTRPPFCGTCGNSAKSAGSRSRPWWS